MTAGLLELGEILLGASTRRLEMVSRNIANTTTPGYKRGIAFSDAVADAASTTGGLSHRTDFSQGALQLTGLAFDLAISGDGFFQLRGEDTLYYTRSGSFERAADGRLINAQGLVLQSDDGHDVVVASADVEIQPDGTVIEGGLPMARIGVFAPPGRSELEALGGALFVGGEAEMLAVVEPAVRQGFLEGANTEMANEMVDMMAAMRQAETGARVIQTYDALIGQSISTFGRGSR